VTLADGRIAREERNPRPVSAEEIEW